MGRMFIFLRAFKAAFRSISSVKWKASISILTIFIGALAITTTFTISSNVDVYVDYLMNQNGGAKVSIFNFSPKAQFEPSEIKKFKDISVVKKVYAVGSEQVRIRLDDQSSMIKTFAVTKENWNQLPYKLLSGSFISPIRANRTSHTIVLTKEAAKKFGSLSVIGKYLNVKMKGEGEIRLKVIGIVELTENQFDQGSAYIDFDLYQSLTGKKTLSELHVVGTDSSWMNWIENFSNLAFNKNFKNNFFVNNPLSFFIETKNQLSVFIQMGYILGFLALIAGAIGSTSVMVLNINLRRREIGLYKAMGFSPFIILVQFTCETLILSLFGGVLGGVLGSILGYFISLDMFPIAKISLLGFGLGLMSATMTGLIFGMIPAMLAAKTDPVKALQG
jgi:putative ABC transport system permease protein